LKFETLAMGQVFINIHCWFLHEIKVTWVIMFLKLFWPIIMQFTIEVITPECIINEFLISGGEVNVIIPRPTFKLTENTNPNSACTNCVLWELEIFPTWWQCGDVVQFFYECGTIFLNVGVPNVLHWFPIMLSMCSSNFLVFPKEVPVALVPWMPI
jgi:hypothetical protein